MPARLPSNFTFWPDDGVEERSPDDVRRMYDMGFAGAYQDEEAKERFGQTIVEKGGDPDGAAVAHEFGFAGSGAGKLVIPFVSVVEAYPGCWPGPAQTRGDCVSHSQKNAILGSMVGDVVTGKVDEKTGGFEALPEVPTEGISQGVLSTEAIYWYRRHGGDGWNCDEAANVTMKESGLWVRKDYPEIGVNLTKYSGSLAGKYGSKTPPENITTIGKQHLIETATFLKSFEECRDFLDNWYFITTCGSEGISDSRDANGFSKRQGSWAHAMGWIGADDRDVIKAKYGEGLVLDLNSWAVWNSGPRDILDSAQFVPAAKKERWIQIDLVNPTTGNIMIPKGSCWIKFSEFKRREIIAESSVRGFPARRPTNFPF